MGRKFSKATSNAGPVSVMLAVVEAPVNPGVTIKKSSGVSGSFPTDCKEEICHIIRNKLIRQMKNGDVLTICWTQCIESIYAGKAESFHRKRYQVRHNGGVNSFFPVIAAINSIPRNFCFINRNIRRCVVEGERKQQKPCWIRRVRVWKRTWWWLIDWLHSDLYLLFTYNDNWLKTHWKHGQYSLTNAYRL